MVVSLAATIGGLFYAATSIPRFTLIAASAVSALMMNFLKSLSLLKLRGRLGSESPVLIATIAIVGMTGTALGRSLTGALNDCWFVLLVHVMMIVSAVKLIT